jgi:hypothetical protein
MTTKVKLSTLDLPSLSGTAANLSIGGTANSLAYGIGTVHELGRYLDLHGGTGAATDYDVRLDAGLGTGGTGASTLTITADGGVICSGDITALSDERLKTNWRDLSPSIVEDLANVKNGIYDRTDSALTQVGVSAQSLREILPNAVLENDDGILSVAYGNAALVLCVELAKEIQILKQQIVNLENK